MINRGWKINDLVVLDFKNNKENYITDIGVIESFSYNENFADIKLLYSKFSLEGTYIHSPRNEVYIIGNGEIK